MGESFIDQSTSSDNVNSNTLSKPTHSSPVTDDDDEPPSSSGPPRSLEITTVSTVATNENEVVDPKERRLFSFFHNRRHVDPEKQDLRVEAVPRRFSRSSRLRALFTPARDIGPQPTYRASALNTLKYSPLNLCLLFIPVSWVLHYTHQSATIVFVFSALAIIPLAALLGLGTEQIALRTSASVGGLLNATLGNVVELIIAGIALKKVCPHFYILNPMLILRIM
jgi:Ca2+:H+ antiporter